EYPLPPPGRRAISFGLLLLLGWVDSCELFLFDKAEPGKQNMNAAIKISKEQAWKLYIICWRMYVCIFGIILLAGFLLKDVKHAQPIAAFEWLFILSQIIFPVQLILFIYCVRKKTRAEKDRGSFLFHLFFN